jgi:hypothetical protein
LNPSVSVDTWTLTETPNGKLSSGGLTLTFKKGDWAASRGTIGWTYGVHEWVMGIDSSSYNVYVGITQKIINPVHDNIGISCLFSCYSGEVFKFRNIEVDYMDVPDRGLPVGSLISVRLDLDQRTLTFGVNGKWHDKPALTDVAWYPYVYCHQGVITIVRR